MPNGLVLLELAASKLAPLTQEVVFLGGSVLALMITDQASAPLRGTVDVDVIVESTTYAEYVLLSNRLRGLGFSEDTREGAPLCRWVHGELTLDAMPVTDAALGFSNRWYRGALDTAVTATLPSGAVIRVITAPFFLGTKMEAFRGRGRQDFWISHDLEDFVAVVEGRDTLLDELSAAPGDLVGYLAQAAKDLLAEPRFRDALPGYLAGDSISQQRVPLVLGRLQAMSRAGAR